MFALLASPTGILALFSFFFVGALGSLLTRKYDTLANAWSSTLAIMGCIWGLLVASAVMLSGATVSFGVGRAVLPILVISFHSDMLSAFFIFLISLIGLLCSVYGIGYIKHYYGKYDIGVLGFFYNVFILGILLVVTAGNGMFFLIGWEVMSVASYFLIVYDRHEHDNVKAGFLYLVMTYIGTTFIVVSFLLLYKYTHSFDFEVIKHSIALVPASVKNAVFVLATIGFGIKAGIVPLHIWLPTAHPAAPSHVSAFLSGVMIKVGIFMMIRLFLDVLQPIPLWWGAVVLMTGAISSLLGVLYALTEHDIKRLLAYHSIENIGIILLGLGSSLIFTSLHMLPLALLSLVAALFHTLNHAIFKSLLFLSAGSAINQVHTRNMEKYGGLIKYMPYTAFFFLVGSMAISALPPFNGFFSEWMTYQSLFQGIMLSDISIRWMFISAAGALTFTGGLALACFVKAFGIMFLARPRSAEVSHAKESSLSLLIGMGSLAALSLLFGVFSGRVVLLLEKIARGFTIFQSTESYITISNSQAISVNNGFASISGVTFLGIFILLLAVVGIVVRFGVYRRQQLRVGATWDCGTDLAPRMEITATGFAQSIVLIFKGILKPSIQHEIEYQDSETRYLPKSRTVILGIGDVYQSYFYQPLRKIVTLLSLRTKHIQSGNVNTYISYIFIALVIALLTIL